MISTEQFITNQIVSLGISADYSAKCVAIYGTGDAAERLYIILRHLSFADSVKCFIDKKERALENSLFFDLPVFDIDELPRDIEVIIIAAYNSHIEILHRIERTLGNREIKIVDLFQKCNTPKEKREYIDFIENKISEKNDEYVEYDEKGIELGINDTKIIAWYLPQFYSADINNVYHGMGFTEWTNTSRAFPYYTGHYQPHIPFDVGYYSLTDKDTWDRQAFLANHYGIYGFAIHYYWFDGKTILEKPLEVLKNNRDINIKYFLNWATEDWSMEWDDGYEYIKSKHTFLKQNLPEDPEEFMYSVMPFFEDERYIRIDNKPVLSIYKPAMFDKNMFCSSINAFRRIAERNGFPGLYIILLTGGGFDEDCSLWNGDSLAEYQPTLIMGSQLKKRVYPDGYINPYYKGNFFDYKDFLSEKAYFVDHKSEVYFRCAVTSWDNSARKARSGAAVLNGITPETMKDWLVDIINESHIIHTKENDIVFLSSWNEWAEGSHLEPDMKYGYAWLDAVKRAIIESRGKKNETFGKCYNAGI